jgi:2-polyprenyl-3-methyl-5-hydroxy-6-metoxy-1,4-benzoquinol methylase
MQNNWQQIWNKKEMGTDKKSLLEKLIDVDGFSSPFGKLSNVKNWEQYIEMVVAKLNIKPGDSIFEVGCGAGAFLYPFYQKGHQVGGIDYAPNLVSIARVSMPDSQISTAEASRIPSNDSYDIVISNGVFLYFPNYDYATEVLRKMVSMAKRGIGIFDIPDLSRKDASINERVRTLGEAEYEKRYTGLDHLYYSKEWFQQILGKEIKMTILDQSMGGYGNSKYRFNVFISKD